MINLQRSLYQLNVLFTLLRNMPFIIFFYFTSLNQWVSLIPFNFTFADCEKIKVPSLESVRHLILGSVHSNSGETNKARVHYLGALRDGEMLGDIHASAFASYELGMLLCRNYEVSIFIIWSAIIRSNQIVFSDVKAVL